MMRKSRFCTSAVLAGIAAVAVGGCGVVPAPGINPPATSSARAVATSARTPQQRAEADIAANLKRFVPPPDAHQVSSLPASTLNKQPPPQSLPDFVTRDEWWLAAGSPKQVIAWEVKHLPSSFGSPGEGEDGRATWVDDFILPDVPGVLAERQFSVATTAVGHGQTGIEVIAQAQWLAARPASEEIPAAARVVTLTLTNTPGLTNTSDTTGQKPQSVTVTDPVKVRRIAALLDRLTITPPDPYSCPAERGGGLTLAFKAKVAAPALAIVTANLSGCAFISLTIGGKQQPGLGPVEGGPTLARQAVKIAGLNWKISGNPRASIGQ